MMKNFNKYIKGIIIFIILVLIPFLPYKFPEKIDSSVYLKLRVSYAGNTGITILEGEKEQETIKKDIANGGTRYITNLDTDEEMDKLLNESDMASGFSGNVPQKELTTYEKGIPSYNDINYYGRFLKSPDGRIVFYIYKWYPQDIPYIPIMDTVIWKETLLKLYLVFVIILLLLILKRRI